LWVYWRPRLEGAVDVVGLEGPVLVASNHGSFLDPWLVGEVFPRPIRYLVAHEWYHRNPVLNAIFRAYGTVPVRERDPRTTLETVGRHLDRGEAIGIFPEGRVSDDGQLQRFRPGLAHLAARSGAPVIPLGVRGSFESLPRHGRLPRPTRVRVHVAPPVVFEGAPLDRSPTASEVRRFNEELYATIAELAGMQAKKFPVGCW
jgi:1-acyl-sn-glycerol-3-phosphate acyltransferase